MGSQNGQEIRLKCPVCAAGFRGVEICPRCGTDLGHVMRIAARAWAMRQKSRTEFRAGDLPAALASSAAAWRMQKHGVPVLPLFLEYVEDRKDVGQISKIDAQPVEQEVERSGPVLNSPIVHDATTIEFVEPESSEPMPAPQKQTSIQTISTRLGMTIRRLQSAIWHSSNSQNKQESKVKDP